ncbi:hypothetical protein [Wolinella succinogenes]|uniref:hypothetical protein n=1 Tax=Wolinella succinogenes TaxID=844 RepID=UPI0002E854F5|nr:hypothetical protein [Wolinella succinogenes]VEG81527.1 Uncharacterised protein [Wolinella succinogenes]HCZ18838.1 hypothetical protein [Helicobacter sp.]
MSWLREFKIALVEQDLAALERIISQMPDSFECLEEMQEAQAYMEQAREIFLIEREKVSVELERLSKMKKFVQTERKKSINTHF